VKGEESSQMRGKGKEKVFRPYEKFEWEKRRLETGAKK